MAEKNRLRCGPMMYVLVFDRDEWMVRMMTSLLTRRGYTVETADHRQRAETLLKTTTPDLLVADVHLEAFELSLDWIANLAEERRLPVLLLGEATSPDRKLQALRVPHSDYLDKPFRFDEFDLRVERLLLKKPQAAVEQSSGLLGKLADLSLTSLLLLVENERKTGVLTIRRVGETGRFFCGNGKLLSVERIVAGERPERSLEAMYALLSWPDGEFAFSAQHVPQHEDEGLPITQLLLGHSQRLDEETHKRNLAV